MADRGIRIPIVSDVAAFLRGMRDVEGQLSDTARDLDRLADRGDDSATDLAQSFDTSFRRIETDAADTARDLPRNFDQAYDRMRRDADRAGDQVSDELTGGVRGNARTVAAEAGSEFVESWGESIRAGNPAEAVGETITQAGMVGGALGPIGAAVGLGVAAAGGLIMGFRQRVQERRDRVTNAAASLFDDVDSAAREGGISAARAFIQGYVSVGDVGRRLSEVLGTDTVEAAWQKVGELAADSGLSADTVTRAVLGQDGALRRVQSRIEQNDAAYERNRDAAGQVFGVDQARYLQLEDIGDQLNDERSKLREVRDLSREVADANERAYQARLLQLEVERQITGEQRTQADYGPSGIRPPTGGVIP